VINDITDMEEDLAAGKPIEWQKWQPVTGGSFLHFALRLEYPLSCFFKR